MPKYPEHIRKQFYEVQDRRCPVCENEIEYGTGLYPDKPSGLILCKKCRNLITYMRLKKGLVLDNAIKLVQTGSICDGCIGDKVYNG